MVLKTLQVRLQAARAQRSSFNPLPFDAVDSAASLPAAKSGFGGAMSSYSGLAARLGRTFPELRGDDLGLALATELSVWVGRCVRTRSRAVSRVPYRIVDKRTGQPIENHPFHRAVSYAWLMWQQNLFYWWEMALSIHGENYLEKLYIAHTKLPGGLRWINPIVIEPYEYMGRIEEYWYNDPEGRRFNFRPDEIVYHRYPNALGDWRGSSPVAATLDSVNIHRDIKRYVKAFFRNDATPGGYITGREGVVITDVDEQRIVDNFREQTKGVDNAFSWILLPQALQVTPVDNKPPEGQDVLSEEQRTEICAGMEVPKALVDAGDVADPLSAGGTMEMVYAGFYETWLKPELEDIALVLNTVVIPWIDPYDEGEFQWDLTPLDNLIKRTKERSEKVDVEARGGRLLYKEARDEMGRPSVPELENYIYSEKLGVWLPVAEAANLWKTALQAQTVNLSFGAPATPPQSPIAAQSAPLLPTGGQSACVMLMIPNQPDLIALQRRVGQYVGDAPTEWNAPDSFHVTLLYAPGVTEAQMAQLVAALETLEFPDDLRLRVGSLRVFDDVGRYALHFRVRENADLKDVQESVYEAAQSAGVQTSAYSVPASYVPHITMGYCATRPRAVTFQGKLTVQPASVCLMSDDTIVWEKRLLAGDESRDGEDLDEAEPVLKQQSAEDELRAWERKAVNKGAHKAAAFVCEMLDPITALYVRSMLRITDEPTKEAIREVFADARDILAAKAYGDTRSQFRDALLDVIRRAQQDESSRQQFGGAMRSALRRFGLVAFRDGMNEAGYDPESFSADELKVFREWQEAQSAFVRDFGAEVFKQGITENEVDVRATMWANMSLDGIHQKGRILANPQQRVVFRLGPTIDHCPDCAFLDGKVATLEDWDKSGWRPRSGVPNRHACKQFHCECELENTDAPVNFDPYKYASRGRKHAEEGELVASTEQLC